MHKHTYTQDKMSVFVESVCALAFVDHTNPQWVYLSDLSYAAQLIRAGSLFVFIMYITLLS